MGCIGYCSPFNLPLSVECKGCRVDDTAEQCVDDSDGVSRAPETKEEEQPFLCVRNDFKATNDGENAHSRVQRQIEAVYPMAVNTSSHTSDNMDSEKAATTACLCDSTQRPYKDRTADAS